MKIYGFQNNGYQGQITWIETDIRNGFPGFDIVGLPDTGIKESKERVRSAIRNSGFKFPQQRVLVSLHPADQHKSGALFDLGIALSILVASSKHVSEDFSIMIAGELTLGGEIVPAPQALGAVSAAKTTACQLCLVPFPTDNPHAVHVTTLRQAYEICMKESGNPVTVLPEQEETTEPVIFSDIFEMEEEKEILCLAAGGFHSIFMFGPPGVGKTLLCSRINLLLPDNSSRTTDQLTRIYGCSGLTPPLIRPPMQRLNVDSNANQFCSSRLPGNSSLAHGGVLMLDEVNKLGPKLIESIKSSYDSGMSGTYPSRFLMAANMNVCPCGFLGKPTGVCTCTNHRLESYWRRPGPAFLERFDMRIPIKCFDFISVSNEVRKPDSFYKDKVAACADRQRYRYREFENIEMNGQVHLDPSAVRLLSHDSVLVSSIPGTGNSGPRGTIGVLTLSRTIADMADRENVSEDDVFKALELRKYGFGDYYWKEIR